MTPAHSDPFAPAAMGVRIRELRRMRGLTGTELARAADISQGYVTEIELGKKAPSFATLERVARALGVALAELVDATSRAGRHVPVINRASCGGWLDRTDLDFPAGVSETYATADTDDPNAFFVIAQGDSMTGGRIQPGDRLLVSPNAEVRNGDIVLAKGPQGVTVKRYQQRDGGIVLQALNEAYADLEVEPDPDFRVYRIVSIHVPL